MVKQKTSPCKSKNSSQNSIRDPRICVSCKKHIAPDRKSINLHNKSCANKMKGFYKQHVKRTLTCPEVGCGAKIARSSRTHIFECKSTQFIVQETRNKSSKEDNKYPPLDIQKADFSTAIPNYKLKQSIREFIDSAQSDLKLPFPFDEFNVKP